MTSAVSEFVHSRPREAAPSPRVGRVTTRGNVYERPAEQFIRELVNGLTATRSESAVRATIDEWKMRVQAADLDPGKILDAYRAACRDPQPLHSESRRWVDPDTREFVLVCIDLYSRGGGPRASRKAIGTTSGVTRFDNV